MGFIPIKQGHYLKNGLQYIKPSQIPIGESIFGTYLFTEVDVGNYEGEAYILDPKSPDGLYIKLFSCKDLKEQMKKVDALQMVRITLTDILEAGDGRQYDKYIFEVSKLTE